MNPTDRQYFEYFTAAFSQAAKDLPYGLEFIHEVVPQGVPPWFHTKNGAYIFEEGLWKFVPGVSRIELTWYLRGEYSLYPIILGKFITVLFKDPYPTKLILVEGHRGLLIAGLDPMPRQP